MRATLKSSVALALIALCAATTSRADDAQAPSVSKGDYQIPEGLSDLRQKSSGNGLVHEQCFHCIADGGTLNFRVHRNLLSHFQIRIGIHEHMAHAFVMSDDGNLAALGHESSSSSVPRTSRRSLGSRSATARSAPCAVGR